MKRFIIVLFIPLLAVVTIQICLKNPQTREMFTSIESYEDVDYEGITQVSQIEVEFTKDTLTELEIYFNGEKMTDFKDYKVLVSVLCEGVFEIKNNSTREVAVTAICRKGNAEIKFLNTKFAKGLTPVCRVIKD